MLKDKREGSELAFKTFVGSDRTRYLVFRSLEGSFHVFAEVEAKQAARECQGLRIKLHPDSFRRA